MGAMSIAPFILDVIRLAREEDQARAPFEAASTVADAYGQMNKPGVSPDDVIQIGPSAGMTKEQAWGLNLPKSLDTPYARGTAATMFQQMAGDRAAQKTRESNLASFLQTQPPEMLPTAKLYMDDRTRPGIKDFQAANTPKQESESWSNPVDELVSGKPTRVQYSNRGNRRVVEGAGVYESPKSPAAVVNVMPGGKDDEVLKSILTKLPDMEKQTASDVASIGRYQDAISLLDKHGDNITGLSGEIRRFIAPAATSLGLNTEAMDDSQILSSLLSTNAGSLRMEVVGPGPVSNYEQGILQEVSGKTISAAEGVRKLLKYNMATKQKNVERYNKTLQAISSRPGYESTSLVYRPFEIPKADEKAPQNMSDDALKKALGL